MVRKVLIKHHENHNGEKWVNTELQQRENIRKYQIEVTELKNTIIELKYTLEGFNSRLKQKMVKRWHWNSE